MRASEALRQPSRRGPDETPLGFGDVAIRELLPDDIPAVAALLARLRGDNLFTERGVRHDIETEPARADGARWVADVDGIVGYAVAMRYWWRAANDAYAWAGVVPEARGRGLGGELAGLVERHVTALGCEALYTDVVDDRSGEAFVRARGFAPDRLDRISVLDPRTVDLSGLAGRERRAAEAGYRLAALADVTDRQALYELALETGDDMPGHTAPHDISFEEWLNGLLRFPELDAGASTVVTWDGRPVALALLSVDAGSRRARNEETGTAHGHRRRGLATLAKLATIRWAAEHGIEAILTDNAEQNAGMLAINERLGYQPVVARQRWVKDLRR